MTELDVPEAPATEKSVPAPDKLIVCGLPAASSLTTSEALRVPAATGSNITATLQLAEAARVAPHAFENEKSPAFAPVTEMFLIFSVLLPELVIETFCGALAVVMSWPE